MKTTGQTLTVSLAACAVALGAGAAGAEQLTLLAHPAIQGSITATQKDGKGALDAWIAATGTGFDWITADIGPLHDRLQREVNLSSTGIDVGFVLDSHATRSLLERFEPLTDCLAGIDLSDIPQTFLDQVSVDGVLRALPMRQATTALFYNEAIFARHGITELPKTIEGLFEAARTVSGKDENGVPVYGLALDGVNAGGTFSILMAYGATLTDPSGKVSEDVDSLASAYAGLADLYAAGAIPSNFSAMGIDQITQGITQGRFAMTLQPFNRYNTYNDPAKSEQAGNLKVAALPALEGMDPPQVARTTVWSAGIPANSGKKDAACSFVRQLADPEMVVEMALAGNGPVRTDAYLDPRVSSSIPYADAEREGVLGARFVITPFEGIGRAQDIYLEQLQSAILGMSTPEAAARTTLSAIAGIVK